MNIIEIINKKRLGKILSEEEIAYAHDVMDAIEEGKRQGKGVISLRGKMIDAPIVKRASQVLEMEKAIYGGAFDE